MSNSWYSFTNQADQSVDVEIYDEIGDWGVDAKAFVQDLKEQDGKHINLRINSPGGSIVDGQAIIAALKRHAAGFTAYVDGLAASMASVIACAADKTYMAYGAMMMIHRAQMMSSGDADDLRKDADVLEKFEKSLLAIYSKKTGMDADVISEMLDEETWMDADDALTFGFIDGITPQTAVTAKFTPRDLKARFEARFDNRKKANMENNAPVEEILAPVAEEAAPDAGAVEAPVAPAAPEEPLIEKVEQEIEKVASEVVEEVKHLEEKIEGTPAEDPQDPKAMADAITNAVNAVSELATAKAEICNLARAVAAKDAELEKLRALHAAAKKAMGLSAADVLPPVAHAEAAPKSIEEQYASMPKGPERLAFFEKHKETLFKAKSVAK